MHAFLDLPAMYNYSPNLFQLFKLPSVINRTDFFMNLLMECAELEVKYADPIFFRDAIGWWSKRRIRVWEDLKATLEYEYDPIYNFDRKEEWSEITDRDRTHSDSNTHSDNATKTATDKHTVTEDTDTTSTGTVEVENTSDVTGDTGSTTKHTGTDSSTGDNTTTLSRTAFNTDTMQNAEETTSDGTTTVTYNTTDTMSGTESSYTSGSQNETRNLKDTVIKDMTDNRSISDTTETEGEFSNQGKEAEDTTLTHKGRLYGNIGVTTTQHLIEEQRELVQFDLQKFIIDDFQQEFLLLVY